MNGLSKFLVDSILGESKQPILIDMDRVKFFLGKGYSSTGRDNLDNESSIGEEEDENLVALLDAMAVGNLDHKAFLDQYTRFDKYFGEKGDDREGGKPRLFKLLKHELELDDEVVNTIMTDYNYKDKDMEDEEYYEQYDDMAPDEEWKGPAGATKGVKYDDSGDDKDTVEDYITANSEWIQNKKLNESVEQITALFGGGFKPPTGGHLDVVLKGLQQAPEVNNLKILVGQGKRDGFTQDQSIKIWKLYRDINLIPVDTEIIAVKSPFEYYKNYLRENPNDKVYVFIGTREGSEGDQLDLKQRSNFTKKYSDNVIPLELSSTGGISGTKARALFKSNPNAFREMLPSNLTDNDFKKVLSILGEKEPLNEGRYDTISNKISSDIFTYWKDNLTDRVITFTNTYQHEGEDIDVEATLKQTPEIEYLNVDGGADDETDYILVSFEVNPYELPQALMDISFNLKDVIRHEIEHLTHGEGFMSKSGKYMENDEMIRKMIDMEFLPKSSYFTLEKEVDANLQGMYFRAKKEKRPFRDVIDDYLDAQKITPEEKEKIINLWSKRTKALSLPSIEDGELLNEVDLKKYVDKAKKGFGKFIAALKQEGKESKDAFKLLAQSVKGEKQLSKEEKKEIGNQLKDIFKTIGYVGLFLLPGGSIFSILFNLLKLNKYVLPSAFQPETINEASGDKILYAFDLDDTLITSNSKVIINHPTKETRYLTPAEYAVYEPQPGDDPDFSEFANLKDPKLIKDNFRLFSQILNKSSRLSGAKTIILTARQPEVSTDVEEFLKKYNLPQITLHPVGSSDPNEKLKVIEDYISQGFNKIRFYDDSPKNVEIIRSIDRPGVDVISKLVKHGPLSEGVLNEGKYDSLVNSLTTKSFDQIKKDFELNKDSSHLHIPKNVLQPLQSKSHLNFEFGIQVDFKEGTYNHKGTANPKNNVINIKFNIPPDMLPKSWERIYFDLLTVIRHEVQHLTKGQREMKDDYLERTKIKQQNTHSSDYYKLEKEINSNVTSFYQKAKKTKQPFTKILDTYFNYELQLPVGDRRELKDKYIEHALKLNYRIFENLNEAIVGDKIECDKCDWSWDIKDGGDDLYVCHKCGYDNELLNEDINLDKYVEDWLGRGGAHDNPSINRAFVLKLKQLGYKDFGTIYRILFIKNATKIPDLREHIWANYNGKSISFSKTLEGAKNFMDQLIDQDLLKKGETFVVIKQKSNYYDLSRWVHDKIKEAGGPWGFATVKDHWTAGLYRETQKTQEVLSTLSNNFEIEGRYSKRGKPLNEDINSNTYPFKITNKEYDDEDDSLLNINYQFSTPNNIYRVEFNSFEYSPEAKTFDLSFGVNTGDLNQIDTFQMTGEGNARKIFKTILDIIEDFISKEDIKKIVVDGTDEKRKRIYKSIFSTSSPNISSKIVLKENKNNDPFGLIQFVNEAAEESEFDYTKHIDSLNDYMVKNKMNVSPLPKVTFIDDDEENAQDVMGKTAYYDPNKREIVLYTLLRHPKDILRSYAHEMIHHIQNLEDRLGNITGTDTREDDHLTDIEREAYTDGNLTFRKWTETINEEIYYRGALDSKLEKGNFKGDWFSKNKEIAAQYGKTYQYNIPNLNLLNVESDKARTIEDEFEVKYPELQDEFNQDGEFLELWMFPPLELVQILFQHNYDGFKNGSDSFIINYDKISNNINEITNQEMRYWAFHSDVFSELKKWGVKKYNELKKLAKGERLQAVEHFWKKLEQGKLSENVKDLAPQEEVRIFNENCGCEET